MRVSLVAKTEIDPYVISGMMDMEDDVSDGEILAEFAGRGCYVSYHKPNPATRSNFDYIGKNIIEKAHESVFEHVQVSFYVEGVSRAMLLELERHRHLSFSVLSSRYVDQIDEEIGLGFVVPPGLVDALRIDENGQVPSLATDLAEALEYAAVAYDNIYDTLVANGHSRKEAREAARAIMPTNIETRFVVSGNIRAWRYILRLRYNVHADAEIRVFAEEVLNVLRREYPAFFQDFPEEPFE